MHTTHDVLLAAVAVVRARRHGLGGPPGLRSGAGLGRRHRSGGRGGSGSAVLGLADAIAEPTVRAPVGRRERAGLAAATALALHPDRHRAPVTQRRAARAPAARPRCSPSRSPSPSLDGTTTQLGVVALVALLVWTAVAAGAADPMVGGGRVPDRGRRRSPPWASSPAWPWTRMGRIVEVGAPFTRAPDVRLAGPVPIADPLLVPPLAGALVLAAWVLADRPPRPDLDLPRRRHGHDRRPGHRRVVRRPAGRRHRHPGRGGARTRRTGFPGHRRRDRCRARGRRRRCGVHGLRAAERLADRHQRGSRGAGRVRAPDRPLGASSAGG